MNDEPARAYVINPSDVQEFTQRGSGPGGQHRNKTESAVTLVHKPTNIRVRIDTRSQHQSRAQAWAVLQQRVIDTLAGRDSDIENCERRNKVGSGMRGDKIRTYREQDDTVIHHKGDLKIRLADVLKGHLFGRQSA
ncbi:peptide chain release factor-like protein [Methylobacillus sp. Pita2]|uniref:peptide chain release factor-like protein n=1 Tax=Methylobacillus sp. Pita2 TaxID=3383245 RepID=UPI0038B48E16